MRHYFRHYFVLFTFNSMLCFLFHNLNLPKGELFVNLCVSILIDWGQVTHICVGNLAIIGSDNCLSPGRRHAIIWTDAGILLIGPSETDFNEILIKKIIHLHSRKFIWKCPLIARFMRPTWGPSGTDRTRVGPREAPWTLLYGSSGRWRPFCLGLHVLTF